jgi:hypothetical protein
MQQCVAVMWQCAAMIYGYLLYFTDKWICGSVRHTGSAGVCSVCGSPAVCGILQCAAVCGISVRQCAAVCGSVW